MEGRVLFTEDLQEEIPSCSVSVSFINTELMTHSINTSDRLIILSSS